MGWVDATATEVPLLVQDSGAFLTASGTINIGDAAVQVQGVADASKNSGVTACH